MGWCLPYDDEEPSSAELVAAITWLVRHGPTRAPTLYTDAAENGRFDIVHWLHKVIRFPGYTPAARAAIAGIVEEFEIDVDTVARRCSKKQLRDAALILVETERGLHL